MTFTYATFAPTLALLLLLPCLQASLQVGIVGRTLYQIWATETLTRAGYPHYEIREKSDTNCFLSYSTWFVGVTGWLGSMWVLIMLEGILLRIDVMQTLAETFSYGTADGSVMWQVATLIVLVTSLATHDHLTGSARRRAPIRTSNPDTVQKT